MLELLVKGLLDTVMGMGTVFIVLIFISFIISLFKYIPKLEEKFKRKDKTVQVPEVEEKTVLVSAPATPAEEAEEEELVDDEELAAVIMAAILASRQEVNAVSADKLIVRSIRRARKRV